LALAGETTEKTDQGQSCCRPPDEMTIMPVQMGRRQDIWTYKNRENDEWRSDVDVAFVSLLRKGNIYTVGQNT
jgi:hypothetical protein